MAYRDLSSDLGTSYIGNTWLMRFKVSGTSLTNSDSGQAWKFMVGCTDSTSFTSESPAGSVDGGLWSLGLHGAGSSGNTYAEAWTAGSAQYYTGASFSNPLTMTWYVEVVNNGTQIVTKAYSNSDYSTGLITTNTIAQTTPADLQSSLKYLNIRVYVQAITSSSTVYVEDIEFWNNKTSAGSYSNPCSNTIR